MKESVEVFHMELLHLQLEYEHFGSHVMAQALLHELAHPRISLAEHISNCVGNSNGNRTILQQLAL